MLHYLFLGESGAAVVAASFDLVMRQQLSAGAEWQPATGYGDPRNAPGSGRCRGLTWDGDTQMHSIAILGCATILRCMHTQHPHSHTRTRPDTSLEHIART